MPRICLQIALICLTFAPALATPDGQTVRLRFYSEDLNISFHPDFLFKNSLQSGEKGMVLFYKKLENTSYQMLLESLLEQKQKLKLNDWLFYELMRKSLSKIMKGYSLKEVELTCWFYLTKAGFDTRLTYLNEEVYLYVYTTDEIFEVPMIEDQNRPFVNLTSIQEHKKSQKALYLLNFAPNPGGKAFSFYLESLPSLKPQRVERELAFLYQNQPIIIKVAIDQTVREIMKTYPFIAERQYLEVPLSTTLYNSLIPQLKSQLEGKTTQEAIELLVAFTRSSFKYKEDKEYFGRSKPMIPDEVFHYPYSDCEDRSALFYCLVKELLDLPMIVIAYPDHLTIAVALKEINGTAISFNGNTYFICDPTGPSDSSEIGRPPMGYENTSFQIIGSYK